jgi:hypothetical protein
LSGSRARETPQENDAASAPWLLIYDLRVAPVFLANPLPSTEYCDCEGKTDHGFATFPPLSLQHAGNTIMTKTAA